LLRLLWLLWLRSKAAVIFAAVIFAAKAAEGFDLCFDCFVKLTKPSHPLPFGTGQGGKNFSILVSERFKSLKLITTLRILFYFVKLFNLF